MASVVAHLRLLAAVPIIFTPAGLGAATVSASLPACGVPAPAPLRPMAVPVVARPIAQLRHVPEADLTFSGRITEDGGFTTEARGGELVFEKKSLPGGGFHLDLSAPNDSVVIEFTAAGISVTRNRRQATVSLSTGADEDLDAIRQLLSGSAAVRLTRRAAETLQLADDASIAGSSLQVADALVGLLTGDEGAPGRMSRHLARRGRALARHVNLDCYAVWESRVLAASYEYDYCYFSFAPWNTMRNLCAYRWILQVESYWFSMISCVGFNQF